MSKTSPLAWPDRNNGINELSGHGTSCCIGEWHHPIYLRISFPTPYQGGGQNKPLQEAASGTAPSWGPGQWHDSRAGQEETDRCRTETRSQWLAQNMDVARDIQSETGSRLWPVSGQAGSGTDWNIAPKGWGPIGVSEKETAPASEATGGRGTARGRPSALIPCQLGSINWKAVSKQSKHTDWETFPNRTASMPHAINCRLSNHYYMQRDISLNNLLQAPLHVCTTMLISIYIWDIINRGQWDFISKSQNK